ncbi:nuclear receptor subfamily 0 group B member 2-like [Brienomyrus brachyistius]|uniref:nuclear receptor subfamily 0 group B member 2-like n=1 Tax=Brienomyrus brachyistius TaxID=42636 RepID=UPI0020B39EE3|nr:nuclear receptor subfamily 0 group B member 2-like [Brienomyrus brachyistius]
MNSGDHCSSEKVRQPNAILFNILSRQNTNHSMSRNSLNYGSAPHGCHCEPRRTVCLESPAETCQLASGVLVKTIHFMKSLPSFQQLPAKDQLSLLRSCWVPLFVLGLAQEGVNFEVTDTPTVSMLKHILLNGQWPRGPEDEERAQPTMAGVHKLKTCLSKFWSLDLSPKEYAYLKGTLLFNPDVPELKAASFIESLQNEAQRALREVLLPLGDRGRFARVLLTASALKTITADLVTELFFRPVIGQTDLLDLLTDMLFTR